jgi:hypothetical protein
MKPLHDLFAKYKRMEPKDRALKRAVVGALKEVLGRELDPKSISENRGTVFIKGPAPLRQEIQLKHAKILALVNAALSPKRIDKIL